ncbi:MAG: CPBP family intramembrane metalloprotease [Verrucomicrobiales bacterium]|nr:CPBP family intramembrane metalloprotease [Verrucomicrobiales bacterium]
MTENSLSRPHRFRQLAVVFPALVVPFIASFFYFVLFPGTAFGNSFYSGVKVFLLVWPFFAVLVVLKGKMIDRTRPKRHLASILPGALFGLLVVGLLVLLLKATPLSAVVDENAERMAGRIRDLGVADHFLLFALFISFVHAALEEFFWRWFTFGQATKLMSVSKAHLVAAIGFASHHVVILSQFFPIGFALVLGACVAIGGFAWSWMMDRYNSLAGSWVSHMIVDLGLMWVGWEVLQKAA